MEMNSSPELNFDKAEASQTTPAQVPAPVAQEITPRIVNIEDYAMSAQGLIKQVHLIQEVMREVMQEGEHYGTIPGTQKPTLYQPGAQKLAMTFRLDPRFTIVREIHQERFIAYWVRCDLYHIISWVHVSSGMGSCNSREEKYRWRYKETLTDKPVPKEYWNLRNKKNLTEDDRKKMLRLVPKEYATRKNDEGKWVLAKKERIENDNPWDLDNTLLKMACKRAFVMSVLNGTAASDIFTQDVEDLPADYLNAETPPPPNQKPSQSKPKKSNSSFKKFLDSMANLKAELNKLTGNDNTYYGVLGSHGFEKSNQIKDRKTQIEVYTDMLKKLEALKNTAEPAEDAFTAEVKKLAEAEVKKLAEAEVKKLAERIPGDVYQGILEVYDIEDPADLAEDAREGFLEDMQKAVEMYDK